MKQVPCITTYTSHSRSIDVCVVWSLKRVLFVSYVKKRNFLASFSEQKYTPNRTCKDKQLIIIIIMNLFLVDNTFGNKTNFQ